MKLSINSLQGALCSLAYLEFRRETARMPTGTASSFTELPDGLALLREPPYGLRESVVNVRRRRRQTIPLRWNLPRVVEGGDVA